jgi:hypothetical protein
LHASLFSRGAISPGVWDHRSLGTAEKTIKVRRARVMDKMDVSSLAELVRLAARVGIGQN